MSINTDRRLVVENDLEVYINIKEGRANTGVALEDPNDTRIGRPLVVTLGANNQVITLGATKVRQG